ncbi:MAG: hypothetical protein WAK17_15795 [Candidatus Nitrosopolaris sp.]
MNTKEIMQHAAPRNESYHLAQSSDIGHAVTCGLKFKLPRVMGGYCVVDCVLAYNFSLSIFSKQLGKRMLVLAAFQRHSC